MSKRVVPFGPNPPHPILSARALRIAYAIILRNERVFLSQLDQWWHFHSDPRSQALVFEILCFLAGLKPAVMVGWGDGTTTDAQAAQNWIRMVWDQWVRSLGEGNGEDADLNLLRAFTKDCKWHRLNSQQGDTAQMTGHYLLYHHPPGPAIKLLIESGEYDPFGDSQQSEKHVEFDEAIYANVFDYPVPLPTDAYWSYAGSSIRSQWVSIGIVYRNEIQLGTQWVAKNTKEHDNLARQHLERYRERLKDVILDSDLALSFDGKWEFPKNLKRNTLGNPIELEPRVYGTIEKIYQRDNVASVKAMKKTWSSEKPISTPVGPSLNGLANAAALAAGLAPPHTHTAVSQPPANGQSAQNRTAGRAPILPLDDLD